MESTGRWALVVAAFVALLPGLAAIGILTASVAQRPGIRRWTFAA